MEISIISFTKAGECLARKLKKELPECRISLFTKWTGYTTEKKDVSFVDISLGAWTKEQMERRRALVFIGACGIAVRAIAPNVVNKLTDSPVLVIDEKGKYVIPILSGHIGGANELAHLISEKISAQAVITTATDINHKFAVDLFAKKNCLSIVNKNGIAKVSAKILAGESIQISIENGHFIRTDKLPEEVEIISYPPKESVDVIITSDQTEYDALLTLRPQEYVIGVGCRKGKDVNDLEEFIKRRLHEAGIFENQIFAIASIDVKKEEPGIVLWSQKRKIPFYTYSENELHSVKGDFMESEFVKSKVGVGNVCERAALKASGENAVLVQKKIAEDGMTIAIARKEWRVKFDET